MLEDEYSVNTYKKRGIALDRGLGCKVWDTDGKEYLDCAGGHGVCAVGHSNREVTQAIASQAQKLACCPNSFYSEPRGKLLEKLAAITPGSLSRTFLSNSGTEAVEAAIKFARLISGKKGIISTLRAFHGRTMGSLSATWNKAYRDPFSPLVGGFSFVPYGNARALEEAITGDTAAFIVEPVQGEGGVFVPPEGYLQQVRKICDDKNILLIDDEVQTGFGRTGRMFACQHSQVSPDIMCLAKAIAGGFPMGATVLKPEHAGKITPMSHGSTFGGNPMACVAALATIDYIEQNGLAAKAEKNGAYFRQRLAEIKNGKINEVRGLGLMLGVELSVTSGEVVAALQNEGVLALPAGKQVVRFLPPLTITNEEIDYAAAKLTEVLR